LPEPFAGNARLDTLLKIFHLEDRRISSIEEIKEERLCRSIDFEKINLILAEEKQKAFYFLKNNLEIEK